MKVLHVVSNLRHGGVQTWVIELMRQFNRGKDRMDVLTYSTQEWSLSGEVSSLGGRVFGLNQHRNPIALLKMVRKLNSEYGPYDVIHAHEMFNNGLTLTVAKILGIPVRISHAHNSDQGMAASLPRRSYNSVMRSAIRSSATHMLGVSSLAGQKLYGSAWGRDSRAKHGYCGLDFSRYNIDKNPESLRSSLGIPSDAKVVGHVGRFFRQKNHEFLIRVAHSAIKIDPSVRLVLVGTGELVEQVRAQSENLGISENVHFLGPRNDVPNLLLNLFDLFLLPSFFEGLPLVMLEAQAANVPCLVSDTITGEADVIAELVSRVSLNEKPELWAARCIEIMQEASRLSDLDALERMRASPFDINVSLRSLLYMYDKA